MGEVRKLLEAGGDLGNTEDDQLFYTRIYLNKDLRSSLDMRLDHAAALFQNLNGEADNIEIRFENNNPYVFNMKYESLPMVIHGNGPSKTLLNTLASYVPGGWSNDDGCIDCWRDTLDLKAGLQFFFLVYKDFKNDVLDNIFKSKKKYMTQICFILGILLSSNATSMVL